MEGAPSPLGGVREDVPGGGGEEWRCDQGAVGCRQASTCGTVGKMQQKLFFLEGGSINFGY